MKNKILSHPLQKVNHVLVNMGEQAMIRIENNIKPISHFIWIISPFGNWYIHCQLSIYYRN